MQDEYSTIGDLQGMAYLKKSIRCANTIGAVITESKILTPLCLFIQTLPNDFAEASGNGNGLFTGKLHIQITNKINFDGHNARLKLHYCIVPDVPIFRYHLTLSGFPNHLRFAAAGEEAVQEGNRLKSNNMYTDSGWN